jgi:hypothetical protein
MPHFHIVSLSKAPYRLKDLAMDAGFGFQALEVKITGPEAASYVAKYASKQHPSTPKGFRRVRASRNWTKLPEYEGKPLIVKSRSESISAFIMRAADETGIDHETLYERWLDASEDGIS